jgi:adenylate cyclase
VDSSAIKRSLPLSWLIPRPDEPGRALARRLRVTLTASLVCANVIGAAIVVALGLLVLPLPATDDPAEARALNLALAGAFLCVFTPLGTWWGLRRLRGAREWLEQDRTPTDDERRTVLRGPRRIVGVHVVLWSLAAISFGVLNAVAFELEAGTRIATLIAFAGIVTCSFVWLISERLMRPAAARALAAGVGEKRLAPGIKSRTLLAWAMGTVVPVLGLALIGVSTLVERDFSRKELGLLMIVLGGIAIAVGAGSLFLASKAIADPVIGLRKAVRRVERGELDVEVPVYDGSEIGQLQAGFNSMAAGLRERERIQDLFGRHVGEEVAKKALDSAIELGGERREAAVLFTDVVGSTEIAAERPAEQVVELLNEFFGLVVEVVDSHGGWVNKFEGDAALAVFGAPVESGSYASDALFAARELAERLDREVEGITAAIGVSAGEVVAGNVGERRRFEYTVIGDPVNEAARLTELAKERPERLLASQAVLERATEDERRRWRLDGSVRLRGRPDETRLAVPA